MSRPQWESKERPTVAQMIDALYKARKLIAQKEQTLICSALHVLELNGEIQRRTDRYLRTWVMQMLYPHSSYSRWTTHMSPSDWRQGRLAWLDWMIDELRKEQS